MGNRANVVFASDFDISPGVYLHWNGGPESVYAFLAEMEYRGSGNGDAGYRAARFAQIVGEFFDTDGFGGYSLGTVNGPAEITPEAIAQMATDLSDNGVYVVGNGTMRRFRERSGMMEEMDAEWVAAEREKALAHEYAPQIAERFRALHPDRGRG